MKSYEQFITREEISILGLVLLYKKNHPKFDKLLEKHQESFFWIENNYKKIKVLSTNYFLEKIKNESKKSSKLIRKSLENISDLKTINKQQTDLLKKLKISKELRKKLEILPLIAMWQDLRKEMNVRGNYYLNEFLIEFAKRKSYTLDDLYFISPDEIEKIHNYNENNHVNITTIITSQELESRKKYFVHLVKQPNIDFIFSGQDAKKICNTFENKLIIQMNGIEEIQGMPVENINKIIQGRVSIVLDPLKNKFNNEILVASMTRPEYLPFMKKARAIITDEGGITCHAAIISRELGIPCIVGTNNATKVFKDGDRVEIDMKKGTLKKIK